MAKDEASKRRITLERTYKTSLQDVWDMVLTFDAMHDEEWTNRAKMGWEMELGKPANALAEP